MDQQSESVSKNSTDESLCRLCLGHCSVCLSLFDNNATEMLEALTSIKLEPGDPFTTSVCSECLSDLSNAYATQQKIMQNQKHLENSLTELNIKKEAGDDVCGGTFDEENESDFTETMKQEIKMEVETNEEVYENEYCGSEKTNFIAETDYGHVEDGTVSEEAKNDTLPPKSRKLYEAQYEAFVKWCSGKKIENYTENVFLAYFHEKSNSVRASTLWAQYSMLKSTLIIKKNIDISKFRKLLSFLKAKNYGYKSQKSQTLTREQVDQFLKEAPDDEYLMTKVALILGITGACRTNELIELTTKDVTDLGSVILFNVKNTKHNIERNFVVKNSDHNCVDFVEICRKYMALRKIDTPHSRFFVQFIKNKCTTQPIGKNTFGKLPQKIAAFLNLPDASSYTGHCFRRTSAFLLTDDVTKRHVRRK